jgi:hypothetical protein
MPLYEFITATKKTIWVDATTLTNAKSTLNSHYNETVTGQTDHSDWDYSLLSANVQQWYAEDSFGGKHAASAIDDDALDAAISANFGGATIIDSYQLEGDFSLLGLSGGGGGGGGGTPDNSETPYGANIHILAGAIGSPNPDYVGRATNLLNTLLRLGMNSCRADIGLSNSGVPNQSAAFTDWVSKCLANNITINSVVSVSSVASTTVDTSSNAAIHTQRLSMYSQGFTKAAGLMGQTNMATVGKFINHGSELDVVYTSPYDTFRLKNGNGKIVPVAPTGAGTSASPYVWVDRYNSDGTLAWDMSHHGLLFYFIRGMMEGAKSVTGNVKNGMNFASTHKGRCERLYTDAKLLALPGCGSGGSTLTARKFDWIGLDWYSREENGSTNGVSNKGTAYQMLADAFITPALCDKAFFTECGLVNTANPPAASVSGYTSNGDWNRRVTLASPYWGKFKGCYIYEALTEPSRSVSGSDYSERNYGLQKNTDDVTTNPSESILDLEGATVFPLPPS